MVSSGTPWGVNDTTTDFAGIGEANGRNPQGNEGMQWDFFGNPSDFEAVHNFAGVTPGPTGIPGVPFFPGGKESTFGYSNRQRELATTAALALGQLAMASLNNLGCYALGNSVLIPTGLRQFWHDGPDSVARRRLPKRGCVREQEYQDHGTLTCAQFRAEVFNLFNHPDFVNPYGGPGGAGTPNDINPSRAGTAQVSAMSLTRRMRPVPTRCLDREVHATFNSD